MFKQRERQLVNLRPLFFNEHISAAFSPFHEQLSRLRVVIAHRERRCIGVGIVLTGPPIVIALGFVAIPLAGKDVTRKTLADELGVHPRTINRRYGKANVRKLCPIEHHRKPLIDSGKVNDLAA